MTLDAKRPNTPDELLLWLRGPRRREFLTILGSAALISPATGGAADAFPNRPSRLIIPHQ